MTLLSSFAQNLEPYVPGEQPKQSDIIKLNTNENPYPPSPEVIKAIGGAVNHDLRKYPDPESIALRQGMANYHGLQLDQVFVGNGSDEVLAFAFLALFKQQGPIVFPDISYSFYPVYCQFAETPARTIAVNDDFSIQWADYLAMDENDIGGIIFPNPNAPTGLASTLKDIEALLSAFPNTPIIVDEAYIAFGADSAVKLIDRYSNLMVVQTLSKSHSLAGLRVGFAMAQASLIDGLIRVKNSFNSYPLDRLAQAGALAAIGDKAYYDHTANMIINTRQRTLDALESMGFFCLDSKANFIFAKHNELSGADIKQRLGEHNILVRHFNKPRVDEYCRITIGTDEEMDALIRVLQEHVLG